MKATERTLQQILHAGDQYVIPVFQRYYTWEKANWDQLWDDVLAVAEHGSEPARHFRGLPSCVPAPRSRDPCVPGIIDLDSGDRLRRSPFCSPPFAMALSGTAGTNSLPRSTRTTSSIASRRGPSSYKGDPSPFARSGGPTSASSTVARRSSSIRRTAAL